MPRTPALRLTLSHTTASTRLQVVEPAPTTPGTPAVVLPVAVPVVSVPSTPTTEEVPFRTAWMACQAASVAAALTVPLEPPVKVSWFAVAARAPRRLLPAFSRSQAQAPVPTERFATTLNDATPVAGATFAAAARVCAPAVKV